jgi:hypothetical protein
MTKLYTKCLALLFLFIVSTWSYSQSAKLEEKLYQEIISNITTKISYDRIEHYKKFLFNDCERCDLYSHILDTGSYYRLEIEKYEDVSIELMKDITIYKYEGFPSFYFRTKDGELLMGGSPPFSYFTPLMYKGLVGLTSDNNYIFISGHMFLDNIKKYFFVENFSEKNIESYVKIKYYNYDFKIEKIKRNKVLVYSNVTNKNYWIKIYKELSKEDKLTIVK